LYSFQRDFDIRASVYPGLALPIQPTRICQTFSLISVVAAAAAAFSTSTYSPLSSFLQLPPRHRVTRWPAE
jgi:hypothetical protein